jgi:hypothetical protein
MESSAHRHQPDKRAGFVQLPVNLHWNALRHTTELHGGAGFPFLNVQVFPLNDLAQSASECHHCSGSDFKSLAHHSHAQPLAIEGQKKNGGTIYSLRRLLDVGNSWCDLDGNNAAVLIRIFERRHALTDLFWPVFPAVLAPTTGPASSQTGSNRPSRLSSLHI